MSESATAAGPGPSWVPLAPRERRVLGVLVEKAKTTPEYYPLSVAAIVTGCNQKSNRDPVTNYDQDDVEETLHESAEEGGGDPGRGERPGRPLEAHALRLAEGEQGRAGRAWPSCCCGARRPRASSAPGPAGWSRSPDWPSLQAILEALAARGLVTYLSPPGQKRGVYVAHGLYPPEELEKVRQAFASRHAGDDETPSRLSTARVDLAAARPRPAWAAEIAALRAEVDQLRGTLEALAAEVRELKSALGV